MWRHDIFVLFLYPPLDEVCSKYVDSELTFKSNIILVTYIKSIPMINFLSVFQSDGPQCVVCSEQ